jgi:hypothetical protein
MPNLQRVIDGRDTWKELAVERRKDAESKGRQAKKWKSRFELAQAEIEIKDKKISELEFELEKKNSCPHGSN